MNDRNDEQRPKAPEPSKEKKRATPLPDIIAQPPPSLEDHLQQLIFPASYHEKQDKPSSSPGMKL
jgi:hypothetical protein